MNTMRPIIHFLKKPINKCVFIPFILHVKREKTILENYREPPYLRKRLISSRFSFFATFIPTNKPSWLTLFPTNNYRFVTLFLTNK